MLLQQKATFLSHRALAVLDLRVKELFHVAAVHADQVVMVVAFIEFEHRLATFEVVARQDAGRNLAVLVEAAVRNTVLQLRGIDTYKEFIQRHREMMERGDSGAA